MGNANKLDNNLDPKDPNEKGTTKHRGVGGDKIGEEDTDYLDVVSKPQPQVKSLPIQNARYIVIRIESACTLLYW